jgi:hypothetical protein
MTAVHTKTKTHPAASELAGYLSNSLSANEIAHIEEHLSSCRECLERAVSAYDSVRDFNAHVTPKKRRSPVMKKISLPLILAIISFTLSFAIPRYFIQLLVATLILGIKWVVDSKSAKMLVMIYEAWKSGGEREASRILETLESKQKPRF